MYNILASIFFVSLCILGYAYIGYGLLAAFLTLFKKKRTLSQADLSTRVTVIIPAYNERGVLEEKIENTRQALKCFTQADIILVTDGSQDGSGQMSFPASKTGFTHLHEEERLGKSEAINRAMLHASGEIVIITDANAMVNSEAFEYMISRFSRKKTGAVSGEKKVKISDGSTSGEGLYWKYESWLKRTSAELYTLTGAAGELLAFRKNLFRPLPADAILDDLVLSFHIIRQHHVIDYEPAAYATEPPSKSIGEEFKRKTRISAGVWQTLLRNPFFLNPFKNFMFFFQFFSHRVLRWIAGPPCLFLLFFSNLCLFVRPTNVDIQLLLNLLFFLQSGFYAGVLAGWILRNRKKIPAAFFVPFYFIMMNAALVAGFFRYLGGKESVLWKKAQR